MAVVIDDTQFHLASTGTQPPAVVVGETPSLSTSSTIVEKQLVSSILEGLTRGQASHRFNLAVSKAWEAVSEGSIFGADPKGYAFFTIITKLYNSKYNPVSIDIKGQSGILKRSDILNKLYMKFVAFFLQVKL